MADNKYNVQPGDQPLPDDSRSSAGFESWEVWRPGQGWEPDLPQSYAALMAARIATGRDPAPTGESAESSGPDGDLPALYALLGQVVDQIAAAESSGLSDAQVVEVAEAHELIARRLWGLGHRRVMDISDRGAFTKTGHKSIRQFMDDRLRITDLRGRVAAMDAICAKYSMQGERLTPKHPYLADAVAEGALGPSHVTAVLEALDKIPAAVIPEKKHAAEMLLVDAARSCTPTQLGKVGQKILGYLDPDGSLTEDRDRARRRGIRLSPQDSQLMSKIVGHLDPVTRAMFDMVLAAWAAKGMNNPADEVPLVGPVDGVDEQQVAEAAGRDDRSPEQRNHDALKAILRAALDGGVLGQSHRGLPPHLVVKITESELREQAGVGETTTGAMLPISDVIALAAEAQQHLAVFADHTEAPLYLGHGERLASRDQRYMIFAHQPGCTCPGCTTSTAY
ncbi:DUF222 domain-containing protein [Gordonia bronchialis]|nr:DUF222 domain-containing protein [Gordonia bronchialis]